MENFREGQTKKRLYKRCIYFLLFFAVVLAVVVGVVVWYLTDSKCTNSISPTGQKSPTLGYEVTTSISVAPTTPGNVEDEPWRNLRLPGYIVPIHYHLTLYPDFYGDHGWFYGNETVELEIQKATNVILIHANFLNITRTQLWDASRQDLAVKETFWYEENQFWVVKTVDVVPVSTVYLELEFDGSLTRAIVGFYKSSYVNSQTGQTRNLVSSMFQPVDARRAFPCFDEPNKKAEYSVTLVHRPGYTALSNMPAMVSERWGMDSRLTATKFQRSVKMSTYLVCFVVCDFDKQEDRTKYGTQIRVFAIPERISQASYALHVMKVTMELFEELFKAPFPLPKNDMVAVPDFLYGAMEHWGLVTYKEVYMLYDDRGASAANKQRVAIIVAHEMAHMWFGNLVTMDWWDDLWLNEGFASFVAYIGVKEVEPSWDMLDQMVGDDVQPVMITDAGVSSHPIVVGVSRPDQINEAFDDISYNKGSAVIRMLQDMMGSRAFFGGIATYLVKYESSTATTDDLWNELGQVSSYSVKDVMDTWTLQMGLPYINITFSTDDTGSLSRVHASQNRFLADRTMQYDPAESPFRYRWYVRLAHQTENGVDVNWMTKDESNIVFDIKHDMSDYSSLVKFNANQTGFYRVNYPDFLWERFAKLLRTKGPSVVPYAADRSGLIDDAFNLARGGYLDYDVALQMTLYLDQERDHLPWDSAYNAINYLIHMFENSGKFDSLRKYFSRKVRPVMDYLTWEDGTSHLERLMRANIIRLSCKFGDSECLGNATSRFRDWIENDTYISPEVRTYVYRFGMATSGTEEDWDYMWGRYSSEPVPQEQVKLLYGLAHTRHVWLLSRYLEYCKDPDKVRVHDLFTVIIYVASNPMGRGLAWDWVRANWDYLVNRFSTGSLSLGRLIPNIGQYFNTKFKLQEIEDFFKRYPDAGAGARGRKQVVEQINRNIAWMDKYGDVIDNWLTKQL